MISDFNVLFESLVNLDPEEFKTKKNNEGSIKNKKENIKIEDNELIQIVPYGLSIGNEMGPPVMIFKALDRDLTIPLMINALEAGVTLAQSNKSTVPSSPHKGTKQIFEAIGLKILKCIVIEVRGSSQYVRLVFDGIYANKSLKLKASDILSLCLHLEVPIYTTKEVAVRSRVLIAEVDEQKKQLLSNPTIVQNKHLYMN